MNERARRWRRHWPVVAALVAVVTTLLFGFGSSRIRAGTTGVDAAEAGGLIDVPGDVAPFDPDRVHDIAVAFDESQYEAMLATFRETGVKEWLEGSVAIDGVTIAPVGVRLKGNSSLFPLLGRGRDLDPRPAELPWLIKFDEFLPGLRYQGHDQIAVRVQRTSTGLAEMVALDLVAASGEPSQRSAPVAFRVNGSDPVLRVGVEVPSAAWERRHFDTAGALYKARSRARFTYLGEDPLAYTDGFTQVTARRVHDIQPIIDLVRFLDRADPSAFRAEVEQRVDVPSLVRYLAVHALLGNRDDITGPGSNAYLRFDADDGRVRVITWDLSFAFRSRPTLDPAARPNGHPLVARVLEIPAWTDRYIAEVEAQRVALYGSGVAASIVDRRAGALRSIEGALVESGDVDEDVASIERLVAGVG